MIGRVLVAYGTKSGSTVEVAEAIGRALAESGASVDVRRASEVRTTTGYDAVVLGAPRVTSVWQPDAIDFLERLRDELVWKPVVYFITSMTLTKSADALIGSTPIFQDPAHSRAPKNAGTLGLIEKETTPAAYLKPILRKAPGVVPFQVAFLAGKLDYRSLDLLHRTFFKLVLRVPPGDRRNWEFIRAWGAGLAEALARAAAPKASAA